jgi:FdrA protein
LGDDVFTDGRPHPMIEPTIRLDRILLEANDPNTQVILLDFELGYGSHEDPVGITLPAIRSAQTIAKQQGRHLVFVGYVLGTQAAKQQKSSAEEQLRQAGVYVARTNTHAANLCAAIWEG